MANGCANSILIGYFRIGKLSPNISLKNCESKKVLKNSTATDNAIAAHKFPFTLTSTALTGVVILETLLNESSN